jgi:hypothetical protein
MATQAQIEANRRNAQLSTGPKTDEGKAVASQNALKHGLRAEHAIVADEDAAVFEAFAAQYLDELAPVGIEEETLAERIVHLQWKLRRIPRLEREAYDMIMSPPAGGYIERNPVRGFVRGLQAGTSALCPIGAVQNYDLRLSRELRACKKEYRGLQAERRAVEAEGREDEKHEMAERTQFRPKRVEAQGLPPGIRETDSPWLEQVMRPLRPRTSVVPKPGGPERPERSWR